MISFTFIGHATWLIESGGRRILTDPVLSRRIAGIWPRLNPPGLQLDQMPPIDVVLISHPHLDHMDIPTLRGLRRDAVLVVPRNTEGLAKKLGYRETAAIDNWDRIEPLEGLSITATPAAHIGIRSWGMGAHARGAVGYVLEIEGQRIYFAGDTAYGPHFKEIREKTRPTIALLPIGAYRPWFFMKYFHMSPGVALKAFVDLNAKYCIPYHWGTFIVSLEPMKEPLQLFKQEAARLDLLDRMVIVPRGKTAKIGDGQPEVM